jgi:hypothetical protein
MKREEKGCRDDGKAAGDDGFIPARESGGR